MENLFHLHFPVELAWHTTEESAKEIGVGSQPRDVHEVIIQTIVIKHNICVDTRHFSREERSLLKV